MRLCIGGPVVPTPTATIRSASLTSTALGRTASWDSASPGRRWSRLVWQQRFANRWPPAGHIDIVRQVWAREAPGHQRRPALSPALEREGSTGLGKPLKSIVHPLRSDIPIMLGAGPQTSPWPPRSATAGCRCSTSPKPGMYNEWLDEGFARPGAQRSHRGFEVCATARSSSPTTAR